MAVHSQSKYRPDCIAVIKAKAMEGRILAIWRPKFSAGRNILIKKCRKRQKTF